MLSKLRSSHYFPDCGRMKSRTCRFPNCSSGIRSRGLCKAHGGGKRCSYDNCEKSDQGGGFCITHGGGKRCGFQGCEKSAQVGGKCKKHGGFRKCDIAACTKSTHALGLCRAHIRSKKKKPLGSLSGGGMSGSMGMSHNPSHHGGSVHHHHNQQHSSHHSHMHLNSEVARKMAAHTTRSKSGLMSSTSSGMPEMPQMPPSMGFQMLPMGPPGSGHYQYPYGYPPHHHHQMPPQRPNVELGGPPQGMQKGDSETPWNINELISLFFDPWKSTGQNVAYYNGQQPPPPQPPSNPELHPHPQGLPAPLDYSRQRYNKINGIHV